MQRDLRKELEPGPGRTPYPSFAFVPVFSPNRLPFSVAPSTQCTFYREWLHQPPSPWVTTAAGETVFSLLVLVPDSQGKGPSGPPSWVSTPCSQRPRLLLQAQSELPRAGQCQAVLLSWADIPKCIYQEGL